ncbi:glycoside hydrolase family 3 protein [Marasmius fiardii PR-910]|nr:glycoside hydrolase family 3 protein [Marasmius fiardii PR-910]
MVSRHRRILLPLLVPSWAVFAQTSRGISSLSSSDVITSSAILSTSISSVSLSSISSVPISLSSSISGRPSSTSSAIRQAPTSGAEPSTDPSDPPDVKDSGLVVPDFSAAWEAAHQKASAKIGGFTLEDLVNTATGAEAFGPSRRCVGNTIPITSNGGWPGLCLEDGPLAVRLADRVTLFPSGLNTATTFNRTLIRQRGLFMGTEFKDKGVNVALGPMMNMLRVPAAGRNFEGFGADPFLSGEAAYETVLGLQQGGVQACSKHYIANEQETSRTTSTSQVDDRTLHEIYAQPFLRSVMAGTASIMCSYNQLNGTYACENNGTLSRMLKEEFGFQGFVVSDWGATHSTVLSTLSGLDMDMPGSGGPNNSFFGSTLVTAVRNGSVPMSRVTEMATRILGSWYFLHQDSPSFPPVNFDGNHQSNETTNQHIDVQANHKEVVRAIGAASVVLLKNVNGTLPLKKPRSLILVGRDAGPSVIGPNAPGGGPAAQGILAVGGGSGAGGFPYLISPYEAIQARARDDHTSISWVLDDFNLPSARTMSTGKFVAVVFVNINSSEGSDRRNLTLADGAEDLIQAVAGVNSNTVVVIHAVGQIIMESWIDHPNITAVLWAGAAGQETGNSIADVLYGDFNPSGRLPFTLAKREEDYPARVTSGSGIVTVPYTEGLEIDYRAFDARNITPRFEFGFGLSYTQFDYSNLQISQVQGSSSSDEDLIRNWEAGKPNPFGVGSSTAAWLHEPAFEVSFNVKNVGDVAGGEIPQLYVAHPSSAGEPPRVLKGFTDVFLNSGQSKRVTIPLSRHSLSVWDVPGQGWKKPDGQFGIVVGASSRDGRLNGVLQA